LKVTLHSCYVLHQRPYRESSLLLEVFSSEHGRLGLIGRGARRRGDPRRALLQPLRRLQIAWSGRGELGTLTQVEADAPPRTLVGRRTIAAFYLNELLMRLLHRYESDPGLFSAYETALDGLAGPDPEQWALRIFETRLLKALGYALILDHDVKTGESVVSGREYYYLPDRGPTREPESASVSGSIRIDGATLVALNAGRFTGSESLQGARQLLRLLLDSQLGGRPLASRDLYRSYLLLNRNE